MFHLINNHNNTRLESLAMISVCDRQQQNKKNRKNHARILRRAKRRKITVAANRRDSLKAQLARLDIRCSISECQESFGSLEMQSWDVLLQKQTAWQLFIASCQAWPINSKHTRVDYCIGFGRVTERERPLLSTTFCESVLLYKPAPIFSGAGRDAEILDVKGDLMIFEQGRGDIAPSSKISTQRWHAEWMA